MEYCTYCYWIFFTTPIVSIRSCKWYDLNLVDDTSALATSSKEKVSCTAVHHWKRKHEELSWKFNSSCLRIYISDNFVFDRYFYKETICRQIRKCQMCFLFTNYWEHSLDRFKWWVFIICLSVIRSRLQLFAEANLILFISN